MTFSQKSASFRLQYGDEIPDTDQCIILVAFLWREPSFGAFVGQFFDPPLHLPVGTQSEQRLGAPPVKALSDSRKHAFESSIR